MLGMITPILQNTLIWGAKEATWHFVKKKFISKMTEILQRHFSEPIMKGLAHFMSFLIEDNWDKISQYTSVKDIGRFLLNNIFRGSVNLFFGTSKTTQQKQQPAQYMTRKLWQQNTPIRFKRDQR